MFFLREGDKIKIKYCGTGHSRKKDYYRDGVIFLLTKKIIGIKFENYKECMTISDIINPTAYILFAKVKDQWLQVKKENIRV